MRIPALTAALVGFATATIAADSPDTAVGTFRSQAVTLNAKSAVAFRGKSFTDQSDALIVAVSNSRLNAAAIADYVDRRRVLETRVRNGETGVVYFEFGVDGRYRAMSYAFGPGNGCAYCAGDVVAAIALANGRLSGKLTSTENDRSFEITLVTPLMSDDHGAPLPEGGGEPADAYLAYHRALANTDRAALKPLLSKDQQQFWSESEARGSLGAFIHALANAHPVKAVAITRGYSTGTKAVLLIAGDAPGARLVGEVLLLKEGGAWRVDDELTEVVR